MDERSSQKPRFEVPPALREWVDSILGCLNPQDLKTELRGLLMVTAENYLRMAVLVWRLEQLGEELDPREIRDLHYLRRIAAGVLDPEVLFKFIDKPQLLNKIEVLSIDDQRHFVEDKPIKVFNLDGQDYRMVPPSALTGPEIKQVFDKKNHRLRTEDEQVGYLRDQVRKRQIEEIRQRDNLPFINKKNRTVVVPRPQEISFDQIMTWARELGRN